MEFLFTDKIASIEALLFFGCIFFLLIIFGYEGYLHAKNILAIFRPRRSSPQLESDTPNTEIIPIRIPPEKNQDEVIKESQSVEDIPKNLTSQSDNIESDPSEKNGENPSSPENLQEVISPFLDEPLVTLTPDNQQHQEIENIITDIEVPEESIGKNEGDIIQEPDKNMEIIEEEKEKEKEEEKNVSEPIKISDIESTPTEDTSEEKDDDTALIGTNVPSQEESKEASHMKDVDNNKKEEIKKSDTEGITPEKSEKIYAIVNQVKTLIARGQIDEARILLINGLAIEKDHRELNLLMAGLYEKTHAYDKAELIFKDLAHLYPNDTEILLRLATVLALQRKYEICYELYKKILSLSGETEEVLYALAHLATELGKTDDAHEYSRLYLKQFPRNPEVLWLYAQALITKNERKEAIEVLIKLKNLTPYNQEIVDLITKLAMEEEMAGNFGEEK